MRRFANEPLLHFLLLGALLFALYGFVNRGASAGARIVVTPAVAAALQAQFERVWQRAASPQELQGLVDGWVRDEVLYREGLAAGLDRDDPVVRRRIAQKMQFMADAAVAELPTEAELQQWLDENPARYRVAARSTLQQVFVDAQRRGSAAEPAAERLLADLRRGRNSAVGDASLLPPEVELASRDDLERLFGSAFADAVGNLPLHDWHGPLRSEYGLHLVQVVARDPGRAPRLDEVRSAVERDLMRERSERFSQTAYETMRARYQVVIEPAPAPVERAAAVSAPALR